MTVIQSEQTIVRAVLAADPALSVVVPLYNKEREVQRALRSVLAQTFADFEVIVVDDGSTDASVRVASQIVDRRIRLVRQENGGVSAARNRGISEAQASLIAFLDADDEWMPHHLETLIRLRRVYPNCQVFAAGYVKRVACGPDHAAVLRGVSTGNWEGVLEDYFGVAVCSDPPIWSSAVAVTKTAISAVGGFPLGIAQGEDLLTWARLAVRFPIAYSVRPSAVFWQPESASRLPTRRPAEPDLVGRELQLLLAGADEHIRPKLRRYIGLWHKMRGTMYMRLGHRAAARRELRRSWELSSRGWKLAAYRLIALLPEHLGSVLTRSVYDARRPRNASRAPLTTATN